MKSCDAADNDKPDFDEVRTPKPKLKASKETSNKHKKVLNSLHINLAKPPVQPSELSASKENSKMDADRKPSLEDYQLFFTKE